MGKFHVQVLQMAAICLMVCSASRALAQALTNMNSTPVPGSGHEYIQLLDETVNPANGALSLRINIPMPSGRGITVPYGMRYDTNGIYSFIPPDVDRSGFYYLGGDVHSIGGGGWGQMIPNLSWDDVTETFYFDEAGNPLDSPITCGPYQTNYLFTTATGERHALLGMSYGPEYGSSDPNCFQSSIPAGPGWGGDREYRGYPSLGNNVADTSGNVYSFEGGSPEYIEDRNGNRVSYSISYPDGQLEIVDTLQRTAVSSSTTPISLNNVFGNAITRYVPATIQVSGISEPYVVTWAKINPDFSLQTYDNNGGSELTAGLKRQELAVITDILLPDKTKYHFDYDPAFGLLKRITYPSGAWVNYQWDSNDQSDAVYYVTRTPTPDCGVPPGYHEYDGSKRISWPVIKVRDVSFDGTNVALHQEFSYSTGGWEVYNSPSNSFCNGTEEHTAKWTTKQTTITNHNYVPVNGSTREEVSTEVHNYDFLGRAPGGGPIEKNTVYTDAHGTRTVSKTWEAGPQDFVSSITTTMDGQTSKIVYGDRILGDNPLSIEEYDFNQSIPTRKTAFSYSYLGAAGPDQDPPSSLPSGRMIVERKDAQTFDASGTLAAATVYCYDQTATIATSGVVSHNSDASSFPLRGNLSQKLQWLNPSGGSNPLPTCGQGTSSNALSTTYTYDDTGQMRSMTDPKGNSTVYSYSDNFSGTGGPGETNAYATKITYPATNGVDHIEKFTYAYSYGKKTEARDFNDQPTSYLYEDPFRRLTNVAYPDNGGTSFVYDESSSPFSVTTSTKFDNTRNLVSKTLFDGFGHVFQSCKQIAADWLIVEQHDDGLGRVSEVSNPFSGSCGTSGGSQWTRMEYDLLGRKTLETAPDSTTKQWSYFGNVTTFTDEMTNPWVRTEDAFGRLIGVTEPGGLKTIYGYDALGNLVTVDQVGNGTTDTARGRSFSYDSLSRLITAQNPETGTICYGQWTNGVCANGYDSNGNLQYKTDAHGIAASYGYDSLNRLISKTYSDNTPSSCYLFDTATTNGIGRLATEWTQASACAASPPSNPKTLRSILSYDAMGRVLQDKRCIGASRCIAQTYRPMAYGYDLAGNLTSSSDGFGSRTFTTDYDPAGRLEKLSELFSNTSTPLFSVQKFGPFGWTDATRSANLKSVRSYDDRSRLTTETVTVP